MDANRPVDLVTLERALRDFESKDEKKVCPVLEQFLQYVAKTGDEMVHWSKIKNFLIFKVESAIEEFKDLVPTKINPTAPKKQSAPGEALKVRIIRIIDAYDSVPFTIQRLCELLAEPRRHYTEADAFLRALERSLVPTFVYPTLRLTEVTHSSNTRRKVKEVKPKKQQSQSECQSEHKPLKAPVFAKDPSTVLHV